MTPLPDTIAGQTQRVKDNPNTNSSGPIDWNNDPQTQLNIILDRVKAKPQPGQGLYQEILNEVNQGRIDRGETTVTPIGLQPGDRMTYNKDIGVASGPDAGDQIFTDPVTSKQTFTNTGIPYVYTGNESSLMVDNTPVPVMKGDTKPTISPDVKPGQPIYWDPIKNVLGNQISNFPMYEVNGADGKPQWSFKGQKPAVIQNTIPGFEGVTGPADTSQTNWNKSLLMGSPASSLLNIDREKMQQTVVGKFGTPVNVDPASTNPVGYWVDRVMPGVLRNLMSTFGNQNPEVRAVTEFAASGIAASFSIAKSWLDDPAQLTQFSLPESLKPIDIAKWQVGMYLTPVAPPPTPAEVAEGRKLFFRSHGMDENGNSLNGRDKPAFSILGIGIYSPDNLVASLLTKVLPTFKGKNLIIDDISLLPKLEAAGQVEWKTKTQIDLDNANISVTSAMDDLRELRSSGGGEYVQKILEQSLSLKMGKAIDVAVQGYTPKPGTFKNDLLATAKALGFQEPKFGEPGSRTVMDAQGAHKAAVNSMASDFLLTKAQDLTNQGFANGDWQSLRDALDLTRLAGGGGTHTSDPYFAYTWINRKDLENDYLNAVATVELRLGRPLTNIEAWGMRDNYSDPFTELVGDMTFDYTNVLDVGILWEGTSFIRKPIAAKLGKMSTAVLESSKVAQMAVPVTDFFKRASARSAASKLAHTVNEVFMFVAKEAESRGVKITEFDEMVGALGDAMESLDKVNLQTAGKNFGDRQVEMTFRLSRTLSDAALEGVSPSKWRELMPAIRDEVYKGVYEKLLPKYTDAAGQVLEKALNEEVTKFINKPTNWMSDVAQVFKTEFLGANRAHYADNVFGALAKADDKMRGMWVKAVLSSRPAWVMRNMADNMFRVAVFGMNPFEAMSMFDPELTKRLAASGVLPTQLTHTFAREAVARAGETIPQQFLKGDAPRNMWELLINNFRSLKDAQAAALATADFVQEPALASMFRNFGHGVSIAANTYMNTITDWNSIVEYSFKIRMFDKAFNDNTAKMAVQSQKLMLQFLAEHEITNKNSIDAINQIWHQAGSSPAALRNLLTDLKSGDAVNRFSTLAPDGVKLMLAGMPESEQMSFVNSVVNKLHEFLALGENASYVLHDGTLVDLTKMDAGERAALFFDELQPDLVDKRNALLNSPDLRDAPGIGDPNVAAHTADEVTDVLPQNPVAAMKKNMLRTENVDQPTAAKNLRQMTDSRNMISNFRDSLGDNVKLEMGAVEGGKFKVVLNGDQITITMGQDALKDAPTKVRLTLREAITEAVRTKYADEAGVIFKDRAFGEDFLRFLRDPEVLKAENPEQFRFFAEKMMDNPSIAKTLAGLQNRDYLKFLDVPDLSAVMKISEDMADAMKYMDGDPRDLIKYSGPFSEQYYAQGARQAKARAVLSETMRAAKDSSNMNQAMYLFEVSDRGTYLVSQLNKFFLDVWPGPRTKSGVMRARGFELFFEAKSKMYDAVASVYERETMRVAGMADEFIPKVPDLSFTDWMGQVGFNLEFKEDGSVAKIWMARGNGERVYLSNWQRDRFVEEVLGQRLVNSANAKNLLKDQPFTGGVVKAARMNVAEEITKRADPFLGTKQVLEFKQGVYAQFEEFENPSFTREVWKEMVDTAFLINDSLSRPAMEIMGLSANDFYEKYLPKIINAKEISDELRASGHALNQELNFYRNGWILKSKPVIDSAPNAMSADQWLQFLGNPQRGIKKAELEDFGIAEFLRGKGKGKVTKAELQEVLDERAVLFVPTEEVRGRRAPHVEWMDADVQGDRTIWYAVGEYSDQNYVVEQVGDLPNFVVHNDTGRSIGIYHTLEDAQNRVVTEINETSADGTKWQQYTLPGGTDYFEKLLTTNPTAAIQIHALQKERAAAQAELDILHAKIYTLDFLEAKSEAMRYERAGRGDLSFEEFRAGIMDRREKVAAILDRNQEGLVGPAYTAAADRVENLGGKIEEMSAANNFRYSTHWDDSENFFAHYRANTHDSPGGQVFHIDEIQSDLHQQGRKYGYKVPDPEVDAKLSDIETRKYEIAVQRGDLLRQYEEGVANGTPAKKLMAIRDQMWAIDSEVDGLEKARAELAKASADKVPLFPYEQNWHMIAFKDALSEAVGNDAKYITWTTGQQQFERWGSIEVQWVSNKLIGEDGWSVQLMSKGKPYGETYLVKTMEDLKQLPAEAGEDWAPKTWKNMQAKPEGGSYSPILDGMQRFYDGTGESSHRLPQDVEKYLRSLGLKDAKVEDVRIQITAAPDITKGIGNTDEQTDPLSRKR